MEKQKFIDFAFVKQHADFDKVLAHYNLAPLPNRLGQLTLRCPFHNDTKPSLKITASKKGFHCFGCGAKGNVLDFVSRMEECDLREAAETLAAICGIDLAPPRMLPADKATASRARAPRRPEMAAQTPKRPETGERTPRGEKPHHEPSKGSQPPVVDEAVNSPLRFALKLDPAHPYLTRRRLSEETIAHFGLGYAGKGLFAGRIAIPIHDEQGDLVAYAGRWPADDGWPDGEEKYKLPPNFKKSRVLYNLHRVQGEEHLVLVEGYFAVFRLHQAGIPAVALMGTSISPEQIELLKRAGVERVIVLLDGDAPGRLAAATVVPTLARSFFVHDTVLPEGRQPDDLDDDHIAELVLGR